MFYVWAIILVLVNAVWWFLNLLVLPGNTLMVLSAGLVTWLTWDTSKGWNQQMFSIYTLVAVFVLAIFGEVLEFFSGVAGAKTAGGSAWGKFGAILGAIVGAIVCTFLIPIPIVGSLIGACGGAFLGAYLLELAGGKKSKPALKSGAGAGVGRLTGTLIKLILGVVIWVIIAVAAFWP